MTNGRGQRATIRDNIYGKYGRYQVHPWADDDPRKAKQSEPKLKTLLQQLLAKQSGDDGTDDETPEETKAAVIDNVLQDIHDRNNR